MNSRGQGITRFSLGFAVAVAGLILSSQSASGQGVPAPGAAIANGDTHSQAITNGARCKVALDPDPGDHDGGGERDGGDHDGQNGQNSQNGQNGQNSQNGQSASQDGIGGGSGNQPPGGGVFDGPQSGSLLKVTSAGATGSIVAPGQTIDVTITWNPKDFGGYPPTRTADCVEIGSKISHTLSQEHKTGPSGGTDHFSYVVPWDGTGGDQICDRATVTGPWLNTEKSAVLCYTVMSVQTPEVPNTLMLPIVALLIFGGGLWVARRRRRHRLQV